MTRRRTNVQPATGDGDPFGEVSQAEPGAAIRGSGCGLESHAIVADHDANPDGTRLQGYVYGVRLGMFVGIEDELA